MIENRLAWEPLGYDATIIGKGPSLQLLLDDPSLARGPIFMASSAGLVWPHAAYIWAHLHPELLLTGHDERKKLGYPPCLLVGGKFCEGWENYPFFEYKLQQWRGGGSALYAAEMATSIGYKRLHIFGVDLTGDYSAYRPYWDLVHGVELIGYGGSLSWMD